ncbi:hypothetical protein RHOSPDRAFT_32797 [Rhodotorula sp. JG-1b]|nr:hypothetical protein RHOSPDRAFT_32797 [Rhodotorula sp. JG-1b]
MGVQHHPALDELVPLSAFEPLRVASHTDMTAAVKFSLEKLATASKRPLVLHTLPPPPTSSSSPEPAPSTSAVQISSKQVETAVDAIPKLVSILEIIKREFPSCSGTGGGGGAAKPNDLLPPLHQYTRLTTFETALDFQHLPSTESQAEDQDLEAVRQELVQLEWLSGRAGKAKRPRKRHSPCMLVVLSREPLSALTKSPHYTYQKPISRSKKRPRSVLREEATAPEAVPLTSTPLPGQGATQRGQQRLPDPSQAGAAPRPTKSAAKDSAGKAVPEATAVAGGEEEETTSKKKKPNRRRTRRKSRQQTETAGEGTTAEGGQAVEPSENRMDISA